MIELENYHFGEKMTHAEHHPESLTYSEHLHRSFELWFCEQGEFFITVDNVKYVLRPNELMLIFPYQLHSIQSPKPNKGHIWVFSPEYIEDYLHLIKGKNFANPILNIGKAKSDELYQKLFDEQSLFSHKSALYEILFLYEKNTNLIDTSIKSSEGIIERILDWVSNNFDKGEKLSELSKAIGYSKDYISKIISTQLQTSFQELINQYRINHACYLLATSDYTITEIANLSGFQNTRTLNRNFIKYIQMTPRDYRKDAYSLNKIPEKTVNGALVYNQLR